MHGNDKHDAAESSDRGQPRVTSRRKGSLPAVRAKDHPSSESAVIGDKATVRNRETLVTAREGAVDRRENAVNAREGTAATREREIRAADATQAASDDHMSMLQQTNARLVITTLEAKRGGTQYLAALRSQGRTVSERAYSSRCFHQASI